MMVMVMYDVMAHCPHEHEFRTIFGLLSRGAENRHEKENLNIISDLGYSNATSLLARTAPSETGEFSRS